MIKNRIFKLFLDEYRRFPRSEVQDYYKLLYQAVLGSEHMVPNEKTCLQMIEKEMIKIKKERLKYKYPLYYEIGIFTKLIRVNLIGCDKEKIRPSLIASAFFIGSKRSHQFYEQFKKNFKMTFEDLVSFMIEILYNTPFYVPKHIIMNFIDNIKKNNFPAVHHSKIYKKLYQPHYRIIPLEIWMSTIKKIE
ncbi:hypothetical protein [Candidatus Harpocratesius sp.]